MKKRQRNKSLSNGYFFLLPWLSLFIIFTIIPIILAVGISFTSFDMVQTPRFIGADNYIRMFLDDDVFIKAFSNTLIFAVIAGPVGYVLSFMLAWLINDMRHMTRVFFTFLFYSPSLAGSVYLVWQYIFSNDSYGFINSFLLKSGLSSSAIQWLTDPNYNTYVVIIVVLWMSMGVGFLSFVAGFKQLNKAYFEAAAIDGLKNRWQELWYVTLPQMRPMLLIGAVLSISGSFSIGAQNAALTGNPSTDYSTHTLVLHIQDYGSTRMELGYASAVAIVLFVIIVCSWILINKAMGFVAKSD